MATQSLAKYPARSVINFALAKKRGSSASPFPLSSTTRQTISIRPWFGALNQVENPLDVEFIKRFKASHAAAGVVSAAQPYGETDEDGYATTSKGYKKRVDTLDLTFNDHVGAFKSKTNFEVLRALLVFNLCSINFLVDNNAKLMKLGQTVMGKKLFGMIMKATFYGQFVAGEDQIDIRPKIHRMHGFGVKSILDYSVEEDISQEQAEKKELEGAVPDEEDIDKRSDLKGAEGDYHDKIKMYHAHKSSKAADRRFALNSARTYFYEGEAACEKNMETFIRCIEAVADSTHSTGFSAIKLTALGRPSLLLQLSEVIVRARRYYKEVSGNEGFIIEGKVSREAFIEKFKQKAHYQDEDNMDPGVKQWLNNMTYDNKGLIHIFSWSGLIERNVSLRETFQVPNLETGKMEPLITAISDEEEEQFRNMVVRLKKVFQAAKEMDVRVMVDAEQSYFQPAIHRLTMEMMRKFNKEKAIVFNTYQCYLKKAYNTLVIDLEQSNRQNFFFGAKLVRGAYMVQERERAKALGYEDPVCPTYDATSEMYHKCLAECMRRMSDVKKQGDTHMDKTVIMVASHNADTVRYAIQMMIDLDIQPEDRLICFGQLLGMCDNLSFPLAQAGYSVYKYVPYGPVNEVLPYLSRRAHENKGMLKKLNVEKALLTKELLRRLSRGQFIYRPKGEYIPVGFEEEVAIH